MSSDLERLSTLSNDSEAERYKSAVQRSNDAKVRLIAALKWPNSSMHLISRAVYNLSNGSSSTFATQTIHRQFFFFFFNILAKCRHLAAHKQYMRKELY